MRSYEAPGFGVGELWLDGDRLLWHELPRPKAVSDVSRGAGRMPPTAMSVTAKSARVARGLRQDCDGTLTERLQAFFEGKPVNFDDVELDLEWATPFQRAVTETLRRVPRGEVVTYGELAALAGSSERAARSRLVLRGQPLRRRRPVPSRRRGRGPGLVRLARRRVQAAAPGARGGLAVMSLSDDVRGELAAIDPRKACCRLAELSALVRTAGSVHLRGAGRVAVHLEVSSAAVARRAFALLRGYGVPVEIRVFRRRAFERGTRYQLHLPENEDALRALCDAGILDARLAPLERPPRRVVGRSCCRTAYLRGAFLAAGSVSGPRNAHLELRAADVEGAALLSELAAAEGFRLVVRPRRSHAFAYVKGLETVAELLAVLGAHETALRLEESAVVGATRARANRLTNADHANLRRATRAAAAQLRAIERLRTEGRLETLAPELKEMAALRTKHPTLSLRELAKRCSPPATKASAQRRLGRLRRLAER